jgi:F420H(2)-dependent quinone reductase
VDESATGSVNSFLVVVEERQRLAQRRLRASRGLTPSDVQGDKRTSAKADDAQDVGMAEMTDTREQLRRFLIRAMSRTHSLVYRTSGGRPFGRVAGMPVLLLTTTGRGSRRPRTATLTYFRDGGDLVVIGSFGGSDLARTWWLNLQRYPPASVLIGAKTSRVTARAVTAEEHDRLWALVTEAYPGCVRYQKRTARAIPIVLLTPEKA